MIRWANQCFTTHESCNRSIEPDSRIYPARLIEISCAIPRLVDTVDLAQAGHVSYATLSHIWGTRATHKLLESTIATWSGGIQEALPRNFRNAVSITKSLNLRYLWIDALCIVQDDQHDPYHEISVMHHSYQNAILNIGGAARRKKYVHRSGPQAVRGVSGDHRS